jgi:transposase-like protein
MDAVEFEIWFAGVARLDLAQRGCVLLALSALETEHDRLVELTPSSPTAEGVAENFIAGPVIGEARRRRDEWLVGEDVAAIGHRKVEASGCPHCASRSIGAWGYSDGLPRYRCKSCRKTFNALTKTPMAGLQKKEQWLENAEAMIEGTSIAKASERCNVDYTTAFRWRHRFLTSLSLDKPKSMSGIVEGDEMFILESFKGKRSDLPRPPRQRGGKAVKRGLSPEQIPVIVLRDRKGATFDAVLPKLDKASMVAALHGVLTPANTFCCDGGKSIVAFARAEGLAVHVLPAPGGPRPEAPQFHINNVNGYHGRFKEWARRFHGVATKNLPNYLGWRRALEALGSNANPRQWILGTLGLGPYQQSLQ